MTKRTQAMMTDKDRSILQVNVEMGSPVLLRNRNTHFSNVAASKNVWWFTIASGKLKRDLHLLCAKKNGGLIWLKLPANTVSEKQFSCRKSNDRNAISLEIGADEDGSNYLRDTRAGGTGYDFSLHVVREFARPERDETS